MMFKNSEIRNASKYLMILLAVVFAFYSLPVFAQGNVWGQTLEILRGSKGVVPCGTSYASRACTVCDIFVLIQNVINLLIFAAMSLGTLAALVIGIRFLIFGSNEKIIQQTKQQFNWLVWGVVVVLCSWLFLNTLFNFVARDSFRFWNQISCIVTVTTPNNTSTGGTGGGTTSSVAPCANTPGGAPVSTNFQPAGGDSGGGGAQGGWQGGTLPSCLDSPGYADGINTNTEGYTNYINEPPEGSGLETTEPGSAKPAGYNKKIDDYTASANLNGVESNRVKAIIQAESSGNPLAEHTDIDGVKSYGLMQIRPDTARLYDPSLQGLSDDQVGQKLKDPNYNIDLGTKYYNNLYQKYNGDNNLAAAAYNGGPVANKPSVNCPGYYRWQCQWDNNEHTVPNEQPGHPGYGPTRRYVTNINSVYSQLSK